MTYTPTMDFVNRPGKPRVWQLDLGRWTFAIERQYEGDRYGFKGSDCWSLRLTLIRNPARNEVTA